MSYERKDEIIMNLKDYNAGRKVIIGGTNAFESKLSELDEVYAKAQAFDEIVRCMEYQQAYDLTDSMVMQDIDYAIRKVFTEEEQ